MADKNILSLKFNQDHSMFTVAMETGFRVYNTEPLVEQDNYKVEKVGSIAQAEMCYRTNYLATISGGSHPKYPVTSVIHYDVVDPTTKPEFVAEYYFKDPVLAVKMREECLAIVVKNFVYVYTYMSKDGAKHLLKTQTRDNPMGLVALSSALDKKLLVFPGPKKGSIQLMDLAGIEEGQSSAPVIISCHQGEIACIALNQQATLVATASTKGTLIRVWDVATKKQVVELRRGMDPATVYCINFSHDSAFLCTSSDKGTVHIFAIQDTALNKRSSDEKPPQLKPMGFLGQYVDSQWGLANFTVTAECACLCAFGRPPTQEENAATAIDKSRYSVIAICVDGTFHKYIFGPDGTCHRDEYDVFLDIGDDMNF